MADIFVNHTGDDTTGTHEGTAYNELQTAINNSADGDKIWVKIDGVYYIDTPIDISVTAGYNNGRLIEGYYSRTGDCRRGQPYFGYRAIFDGQGLTMNCFDYIGSEWVLANLHATNVDGYLFNFGTTGIQKTLINCSGDKTGHSGKYQLYSNYTYQRLIMTDCHFVNDYYVMMAKGYAIITKNCWFESTGETYNGCVSGAGCYFFSGNNCAFISRHDAGSNYCLNRLYSLELINSIVAGNFCINVNSGIYNHILAVNNYFCTNSRALNCYYGTGGLFDYNATNFPIWGTYQFVRMGENNITEVNPYQNFQDWDNRDFSLKQDSILIAAGQPVLSGLDGSNPKYTGQANIGPYLAFPKPTPKLLFKQGG
ncbi:MAG: hypothetical protein JW912_07580 [Sedimentisphaerales bacterium]|nr:hypothetical protein [Sedimentisphaerales bacterium]